MRYGTLSVMLAVIAASSSAWAVPAPATKQVSALATSLSGQIRSAEGETKNASRAVRRAAIAQSLLDTVSVSGVTPDELRSAVAELNQTCPMPLNRADRWAGCPATQEGMEALGSLVALADGNLQPSALSGRGAAAIEVPFEATTGGGSDYIR